MVGPWVPFRVDEVDPGQSWRWTVAGVAATHHAVEATGPQSSRVGIGVPRLAFPYLAVCWVALGRIARLAEAATLEEVGGGRPLLVSPPYDRRAIESVAPGSA